MTCVRKISTHTHRIANFNASEVYLVTLTQDDLATLVKSALHWNVDKGKAMEMICNAGLTMLREVLP